MDQSMNRSIRRFNKRYFNRFSRLLSGFKGSPWSLIVHQGRKSGRAYTTPVVVVAVDEKLYTPLPYGTDVDWLQNVLHHGGGIVKKEGQWFSVCDPVLLPASEALINLPERSRQFLERFKHIEYFLRVNRERISED